MTWFLVEAYAPSSRPLTDIEARIEKSIEAAPGVIHLGSILLPEDETCFHIFDAATIEAVADVSNSAGLSPLRIIETVHSEHWG